MNDGLKAENNNGHISVTGFEKVTALIVLKLDDRANAPTTKVKYSATLQAEQTLSSDQANQIIKAAANVTANELHITVSDVETQSDFMHVVLLN